MPGPSSSRAVAPSPALSSRPRPFPRCCRCRSCRACPRRRPLPTHRPSSRCLARPWPRCASVGAGGSRWPRRPGPDRS
ncbi:hypothetical protein [Ornithinimicrobium kibberense]|uniref:hypothetical protein n=1 Tax=Ornithinimicrobium kibberense TaxID=282060 RepID=UPI0036093001